MFTEYLATLDDDTWHVTITNVADALPLSEPDFVTPDTLGRWDAEEGRPCRPKLYYVARGKCALYALGYLEVQPHNADALAWVTDEEDWVENDYQWIREGGA
jgi:hypothetical protein